MCHGSPRLYCQANLRAFLEGPGRWIKHGPRLGWIQACLILSPIQQYWSCMVAWLQGLRSWIYTLVILEHSEKKWEGPEGKLTCQDDQVGALTRSHFVHLIFTVLSDSCDQTVRNHTAEGNIPSFGLAKLFKIDTSMIQESAPIDSHWRVFWSHVSQSKIRGCEALAPAEAYISNNSKSCYINYIYSLKSTSYRV